MINAFAVYAAVFSAERAQLYQDGREAVAGAIAKPIPFGAARYFSIGQEWDGEKASDFFGGDLAELIVFGRALSAAERRGVELYLTAKYQLAKAEETAENTADNAGLPVQRKPAAVPTDGAAASPDSNLHLVDSGPSGFALYRSGIPTVDDIKVWCRLGIREVMVLSGDSAGHEVKYHGACPALKIVYDEPQSARRPLPRAFLEFFDGWVASARKEGKKILFRCECGCHRVGRLAAYYEIKHMGRTFQESLENLYRYGRDMDRYYFLLDQIQALEDYARGRGCRFAATAQAELCI